METSFKMQSIALGIPPNIGLYSEQYTSIAEVSKVAMVAVANDPVNQGHGLFLAEAAGLVTLKAGVGAGATINNIAAIPRKLKFVEI